MKVKLSLVTAITFVVGYPLLFFENVALPFYLNRCCTTFLELFRETKEIW